MIDVYEIVYDNGGSEFSMFVNAESVDNAIAAWEAASGSFRKDMLQEVKRISKGNYQHSLKTREDLIRQISQTSFIVDCGCVDIPDVYRGTISFSKHRDQLVIVHESEVYTYDCDADSDMYSVVHKVLSNEKPWKEFVQIRSILDDIAQEYGAYNKNAASSLL